MRRLLLLISMSFSLPLFSQDFMLQSWYWDYPRLTTEGFFAQLLASQTDAMAEAGFTYIWLPPVAKGSGGAASIGYDIKDYYDLGDHGITRLGARRHFDWLMDSIQRHNMKAVVDVVYNHRDGGRPETNPALEDYMENLTYGDIDNGYNAFPSDRYRCYLALGGNSGNGAGDYYFKIRSQSQHPKYYGKPYEILCWTNTVPPGTATPLTESEPNGGANCGEPYDSLPLGQTITAIMDNNMACGIDEIKISIDTNDFNPAGDTLWLALRSTSANGFGDHADHRVFGLWSAAAGQDIQSQVHYQTYTDYTQLPSGRGGMDWRNFRPNGNPTNLAGDWEGLWFFSDIDQSVKRTRDTLFEWSRWLYEDIGFRGFRIDAVKHFPPDFMGDLLDHLHGQGIDPGMVVGEFFDGNPVTLAWWVNAVKGAMNQDTKDNINIRVFDFALRQALKNACDAFGYDVRNVFNSALADGTGLSGFDAVTFINNHDFRYPGQEVINNPELAYAYILTNNQLGVPCVFYPDYFENNSLAANIKALMEVHRKYIFGASQRYYLNNFNAGYSRNFISGFDHTSLIYQLSGSQSGRNVVVAINFAGETLRLDHALEMKGLAPGDTLTDIFGISPFPYALVNGSNQIYMEVPPRSFAVWVQGDLRSELIAIKDPFVSTGPIPEANGLHLYPNPAQDQLHLKFDQPWNGPIRMEVLNLQGQQVLADQWSGWSTLERIPIGTLPSGIYVIRLWQEDRHATLRFMKQ